MLHSDLEQHVRLCGSASDHAKVEADRLVNLDAIADLLCAMTPAGYRGAQYTLYEFVKALQKGLVCDQGVHVKIVAGP